MHDRRPTILIGLSVLHAPLEMGSLIDLLLDEKWSVRLLVGTAGIEGHLATWSDRGARIVHPPSDLIYGTAAPPAPVAAKGVRAVAPARPRRFPGLRAGARPAVSVIWQWKTMSRVKRFASRLIAEERPDVFLAHNFHSCGRLDNAVLWACKKAGIPTACMAVSPLVGKAIARPGRLTQFHCGMMGERGRVTESWLAKVLAKLFPEWTVSDERDRIFMWQPDTMLAARLAGLLPKDVWQTPHPDFDLVFAYNKFGAAVLRDGGFPMEKVREYGPPRLDAAICLAQDSDARAKFGLPGRDPYILWNVEPSWEHNYCDADTHWNRVSRLARSLADTEKPVVVALHPLCERQNYQFLEADFGFQVARVGIELLYPHCAFAVSFGCSTNYYALVFGKRILMYDWFGIRQDPRRWRIYGQEGLEAAETVKVFSTMLERFVREHEWRQSGSSQALPAPASPRIVKALAELAKADASPTVAVAA